MELLQLYYTSLQTVSVKEMTNDDSSTIQKYAKSDMRISLAREEVGTSLNKQYETWERF